jgi:hypothetical protein
MRQFPMSLSAGVKVLSTLVSVLLVAVPLLIWGFLPGIAVGGSRGPAAPWVQLATRLGVLLAPLVAVASWAMAPRGVEIEGGELKVLRRAWPAAAYRLAEVEQVTLLPRGWLAGAIRTFGNGGLFGYYGWFYRYKNGAFRLFATRSDRLVEAVIGGRRVVFSPDEPARLVDAILAAAPRARRGQVPDAGAASATRTS